MATPSAIVTMIGQYQQGEAQADAAKMEGELQREQAAAKASALHREGIRTSGDIAANFAASGVPFAGSALDVYTDQVLEAERQKQYAFWEGEMANKVGRYQGRTARYAAKMGMAATALESGEKSVTLLTGAGAI